MVRVWCWFLPPAQSPDDKLSAQRVLAVCLALSIWLPISAIAYQMLVVPSAVQIVVVAALLLVVVPFVLRYGQCPVLCGNLLVALALGTFTALAFVTGGPAAPVAPWFVTLPMIAAFMTGARWGTFWTLLALLAVSGLFAAREMGTVFPLPFPTDTLRVLQWGGLVRLVACIAVLTLVFKAIELRQRTALKSALSAAQAADLAKSQFLANMSHEIRTPLTAILGYTELLLDAGRNPTAAGIAADDALETIHRNGTHLLDVINDILDLSKIEAGRLEIQQLFVSPRQLVAEVVALFQMPAAAKGLQIESHFGDGLPDAVETDPTRLRQVLVNLVGNAVKFTESGGVRVNITWHGQACGAGSMAIEVADSGVGMSQDVLSRLFVPFSQADGSTSRRYGGTGLGLAISQRLVRMMGGSIDVRSKAGGGSSFTVTLPVVRTRPAKTSERSAGAPLPDRQAHGSLADYRLLLADDSADNQRLVRCLLEKWGAEVVLANNGLEAVELACAADRDGHPFDLVLMDMQMPHLDGYEATRRLRQMGFQSPIVALTAHALTVEHQRCLAAGCLEVCTKPIDAAHLLATIRRCLVRVRRATASVAGAELATIDNAL